MDARDEVSSDIRDVFAEAKGNGFDIPALRAIVRTQREDAEKRRNREAMIRHVPPASWGSTDGRHRQEFYLRGNAR